MKSLNPTPSEFANALLVESFGLKNKERRQLKLPELTFKQYKMYLNVSKWVQVQVKYFNRLEFYLTKAKFRNQKRFNLKYKHK